MQVQSVALALVDWEGQALHVVLPGAAMAESPQAWQEEETARAGE